MMLSTIKNQAIQLKQRGLHRCRTIVDNDSLNFSSNDYLSLQNDPRIKRAFAHGYNHYPVGSGASMAVGGYHSLHQTLERTFAEKLNVDSALLFSSGYAANLGIIALLASFDSHLLIDKAIHASIYDGMALTDISYTRFLHNNVSDLARKIDKNKNNIVFTEGVFSMSGQPPPLHKMAEFGIEMIVDEAHSFGIIGPNGLGAVAHHALNQDQVPLRMIPFGKAMGAQGAIVVGQGDWIDALFQKARSCIYSTGVSPAMTFGLLESLNIVMAADAKRQHLGQLVAHFETAIASSPLSWRTSNTPIQQLQLGCPHLALHYDNALKKAGINCLAIREPTVARKETGLRVVLNAAHELDDINHLFNQLHKIYDSLQ